MNGDRPSECSVPAKLTVVCSAAQLTAELREIGERVSRAPGYLQWMALQVLEADEHGIELGHIDPEHPSISSACELRGLPQLSKWLRLLLLALREHEEERRHGERSEQSMDGSDLGTTVIRCAAEDLSQVAKP